MSKRDTYRCYSPMDYFYVIFTLSLFVLPFINVYQLRVWNSWSVIDLSEYYNDENVSLRTIGTELNTTMERNAKQAFISSYVSRINNDFGTGEIVTTDAIGSREIYIGVNGTGDVIVNYEYSFKAKHIIDYTRRIDGLFMYFPYIIDGLDAYLNPILIYRNCKGIAPYNWTNFWGNFTLLFYVIDSDGNGIAYNFGVQESNTVENVQLEMFTTLFSDISVKTIYCNMSGVKSGSVITYNNKEYEGNEDDVIGGIDILGSFSDIASMLSPTTEGFLYANPFIHISQLNGFVSMRDLGGVKSAVKCGVYFKMASEMDVKSLIMADSVFLNDYGYGIYPSATFENALVFHDMNLFLGEIIAVRQLLIKIAIFDVIIILSLVMVGILISYFVPKKLIEEYKLQKGQYCGVE